MPTPQKNNLKQNKKISISSDTKFTKKASKVSPKKVTIKRRTGDLKLSKASATAIASQASHAKEKAFERKTISNQRSNKIPLWVRIFFGCSLLLFCISFYRTAIRPQLGVEITDNQVNIDERNGDEISLNENNTNNMDNESINSAETINADDAVDLGTVMGVIQAYFHYLSNRDFDSGFNLMIPALQKSSEIREHFTAFRMIPFLEGIEGGQLSPTNFQYIKSPTYGKDVYQFDLSYIMKSDQSKYDETWEFTVNTKGDEPKISSIRCVTPKCSYHPIFWPENFGLMR